ncbi:MAG TPA: glycosyltransferase [Chitinophagaceae bacterium]|nr:glycosyltransferase [Chitinophagaceae bacterium]
MKKIAFIIPNFAVGGAEKILLTIANALCSGYQVHIIFLKKEGLLLNELDAGITTWNVGNGRVYFSIFKILKITKQIKPDIIFSWMGYLNAYLIFFKKFFPKNIHWYARESNIPSLINKMYRLTFLFEYFYRFNKNYDKIVCQTQFMANDLIQNYNVSPELIYIIPNPYSLKGTGVNINPFKEQKRNILFTGRLRTEKRVEYLIEALALLPSNYHLNIVGDGDQKLKLMQRVKRLGVTNRVTFFGGQSQLEKYYRFADCLVLCSAFEGLPNVAIEAICNGCPVLAYNINTALTSLDELITSDNGIIKSCTAFSAADMALLIEEGCMRPYDRHIIERDAKEKYSLETAIRKYKKIINSQE